MSAFGVRADIFGSTTTLWRRRAHIAISRPLLVTQPRGTVMTLGARFTKWGLGLFIFGVFLVFGIIGHYCGGARWPTGELFLKNITLWYACPWTLSVASVQAGGLGMVALGLAHITAARVAGPRTPGRVDT